MIVTAAVGIFFITNWVGGHSVSSGYMQLSYVYKQDEAPAYNWIFRIVAPVACVALFAAAAYGLHGDELAQKLWWAVPLSFGVRAAFNVLAARAQLFNWPSFVLQSLLSTSLAYLVQSHLLSRKEYLFPDLETLGAEFWLAIVLFVYQSLNGTRLSADSSQSRKRRFILRRVNELRSAYGGIIECETNNESVKRLALAILLVESYNRPPVVRAIERAFSWTGRIHSFGIMQMRSDRPLSDIESVRLGTRKIAQDYVRVEAASSGHREEFGETYFLRNVLGRVAWFYNRSPDYEFDVMEAFRTIEVAEAPIKTPDDEMRYNAFYSSRA